MRTTTIYCIQRQPNGNYIQLNRDYGPLSADKGPWYDHAKLPGVKYAITPEDATLVSWDKNPNVNRIYLFNDGSAPWLSSEALDAYQYRLEVLNAKRVVS